MVWYVRDHDFRKIGLPRDRAQAREFRTIEFDRVVPVLETVRKTLQSSFFRTARVPTLPRGQNGQFFGFR